MQYENGVERLIDSVSSFGEKIPGFNDVIDSCKQGYHRVMSGYCEKLDSLGVSPNQVVTGRVVAGVGAGGYLALGDHGLIGETVGLSILGLSFLHDAVDGYLARMTQQTSQEGETLDAGGDKIKVFILLGILLATMDVNIYLFAGLIGSAGVALFLDIKSQLLRENNREAFQAFWKQPLTLEERENNPNTKSAGAAVSAGKIKTAIIMSGISLGYMKDIPYMEWGNDNAIPLLVSLLVSSGFAVKSLKDKGVRNIFSLRD